MATSESLKGSLTDVAGSSLPDLTVQSISVDSNNYLTVKVANVGSTDVSEQIDGKTYIFIDGREQIWTYSWSTLSDTNFRGAGESSKIQPQELTGKHTVKVCIDAGQQVRESNEKNNCLGKVVFSGDESKSNTKGSTTGQETKGQTSTGTATGNSNSSKGTNTGTSTTGTTTGTSTGTTPNSTSSTATPGVSGTDLMVESVSLDSRNILTVVVKNSGTVDISSNLDGGTYIYIDSSSAKWTYSWTTLANLDFLKAGQSSTIQPQVLTGTHDVKACVDAKGVVTETNENNNCLAATLTAQ